MEEVAECRQHPVFFFVTDVTATHKAVDIDIFEERR